MTRPVPSFQKGSSGRDRSSPRAWRSPRQVDHYWTFYKKGLYVSKPSSGIPGWLLPLLALLILSVLIFWAAPLAVSRLQARQQGNNQSEQTEPVLKYDDATRVVTGGRGCLRRPGPQGGPPQPGAFQRACHAAAGALPVRVRGCPSSGWPVRIHDDKRPDRSTLRSNRPDLRTRRLWSTRPNGSCRTPAAYIAGGSPDGDILYIPYRGSGIAQVALPDGSTGWISDEGVVILPSQEQSSRRSKPRRAFAPAR
jgi:hypothetical protein